MATYDQDILGSLLIEQGILTQDQLEEALTLQKQRKCGLLGEILVELGYVTEEAIATALAAQYGFPYLPLSTYNIDPKILELISKDIASQYCLIPLDKLGNSIVIATSNPLNTEALEDIEFTTGCDIKVFISTASDIKDAINRYYKQ